MILSLFSAETPERATLCRRRTSIALYFEPLLYDLNFSGKMKFGFQLVSQFFR
jgi:hypothetical protein